MSNEENNVISPFDISKIEKLTSKSVYKNKREFCDAIGADYDKHKSGKAWGNLVGILHKCAGTIEQDGRQITFTRYDEIKPYDGNQRNAKFLPVLKYLIVEQLLAICNQSPDHFATVVYRFRDLAKNLYLINDLFLPDVGEVFKEQDQMPADVTTSRFESFYRADKNMIRGYVKRALDELDGEDIIRRYEARIITFPKEKRFYDCPHYLMTPEQDRRYAEIKADLCQEFVKKDGTPCENVAEIVVSGHTKKYFSTLADLANNEFGGRVDSVYVIHATSHLMEIAKRRLHNVQIIKDKGMELNKLVQESLCQSKQLMLPRNRLRGGKGFGVYVKERYYLLEDGTRDKLVHKMHAIDNDTADRYTSTMLSAEHSLAVVGIQPCVMEQESSPA